MPKLIQGKKLPLISLLLSSSKISSLTLLLVTLGISGVNQNLPLKPLSTQAQTINVATSSWRQASFPVENFQSYTSGFGYRINPVTQEKQFHQGLDLAAPLGSYVRSWWSGKVVAMSDHTACGTMIKIQSGSWTHVYCHLMGTVEETNKGNVLVDRHGGIVLWQGQTVPAGARIARVGMTGRTTGPHLHWGLMYNGTYVDPADVLRRMFAQRS
jgi:murein DD-endopeptidase MepM/ murein hydrolase activator NlpD